MCNLNLDYLLFKFYVLISFVCFPKESSFIVDGSKPTSYFFKNWDKNSLYFSTDKINYRPLIEFDRNTFSPGREYHFKICLKDTSQIGLWSFELLDPHLDYVSFSLYRDEQLVKHSKSGMKETFPKREVGHKNFQFLFHLAKNVDYTLHFSIKNSYYNPVFVLKPIPLSISYSLREYCFLGFFYGTLAVMVIYSLFIFSTSKEKIYLYYVAYVLSYCLNAFREDGLGFQFLWPEQPFVNNVINTLSPSLLIISFVYYSSLFLDLKKEARDIYPKILFTGWVVSCFFLFTDQIFTALWARLLFIVPFLMVFLTSLAHEPFKNFHKRIFFVAFFILLFFFTLHTLRISGIYNSGFLSVYAINFGFMVEILLFSYAHGLKIKNETEEKEQARRGLFEQLKENEKVKDTLNNKLKELVEERTKKLSETLEELNAKKEEIEYLNSILKKDNQQLKTDLVTLNKERVTMKIMSFDDFKKVYPDEESCLQLLSQSKWAKGFICKKCGKSQESTSKNNHSKRCSSCGYEESATAYTLFHRSKIPLTIGFYLAYLVVTNPEISTYELEKLVHIRQKTCWAFKKRLIEAMGKTGVKKLGKDWGKILLTR